MKTLQPLINLGLHTVPLIGKSIYRDGKDKLGYKFPNDWQQQYREELNEVPTPIGGIVLTEHTVVAIDADDDATYDLFRSLDPTNTAYFDSIGKVDKDGNPLKSGTILYKADPTIPPSFRATNGSALDFFNGSGLVFAPTTANKTKTPWQINTKNELCNHNGDLVVIQPMPQVVKELLKIMNIAAPTVSTQIANQQRTTKGFIGSKIQNYDLTKGDYIPELSKYLTPKEYRNELYKKQGHLHPNDINGSGHMYLFKMASILAGDNTVDREVFRDVMYFFNNLWKVPMEETKLESKIIIPILRGEYWEYDEDWENAKGYRVTAKRDYEQLEVFFDSSKQIYFLHSLETGDIRSIGDVNVLVKYLKGAVGAISQKELFTEANDIHTHALPNKAYGYFNDDRDFNLFRASPSLKILNNPKDYADEYKEPTEFINYIKHFIPTEEARTRYLRQVRTKFTTFDYSAVIPMFIGVQGSGKDVMFEVTSRLLDNPNLVTSNLTAKIFMEKHNGWLADQQLVQLSEFGKSLKTKSDKDECREVMKGYTGGGIFQLRDMFASSRDYPQTAMFIHTSNKFPFNVDDELRDDRRLLYISTPNKFKDAPQCLASNPATIHKAIMSQINDIAYYIATEYTNLTPSEYVEAPINQRDRQACISIGVNKTKSVITDLAMGKFAEIDANFGVYSPIQSKAKMKNIINTYDIATQLENYYGNDTRHSTILNELNETMKDFFVVRGKGAGAAKQGNGASKKAKPNGWNLDVEGLANYMIDRDAAIVDEEAEELNLEEMRG